MKKVNPRRRPASEADVKRAKAKASDDAIRLAMAIFLTVLCDGFDFDKDQIRLAWVKMEKLYYIEIGGNNGCKDMAVERILVKTGERTDCADEI